MEHKAFYMPFLFHSLKVISQSTLKLGMLWNYGSFRTPFSKLLSNDCVHYSRFAE